MNQMIKLGILLNSTQKYSYNDSENVANKIVITNS